MIGTWRCVFQSQTRVDRVRIHSVDRADLIARARAGFELAGRGVGVCLSGEPDARYASRAEIKERLAEALVEPELLAGVLYAVDKYDPKWQAVLFLEQEACCTVSVRRTAFFSSSG